MSPCLLVSLSPCLLVSLSPCLLFSFSPFLLVSLSPCLLFSLSPFLLFSLSPLLPFSPSPLLPFSISPAAGKKQERSTIPELIRCPKARHPGKACAGAGKRPGILPALSGTYQLRPVTMLAISFEVRPGTLWNGHFKPGFISRQVRAWKIPDNAALASVMVIPGPHRSISGMTGWEEGARGIEFHAGDNAFPKFV